MDSSHALEDPNNVKKNTARPKTSWVWEFFDSELRGGEQYAICKLNKMDTNNPCKKLYKTGGSTKNCIEHLTNKHGLLPKGQTTLIQVIILKYYLFQKFLLKVLYFFCVGKK